MLTQVYFIWCGFEKSDIDLSFVVEYGCFLFMYTKIKFSQ